ncbi:chemotaxis protein CheB [Paenibacillus sp. FSL M8-0228]|uniref:Protein-glutamate methylesterase/protein-glutamine glutaminase n=1 Tax=Paenibacillus polymyxa TaxID=1406 RepID=A0A8I1IUW8_PAEPO|nr:MULTISPECIES: chemotaxis protein CheB [Paenibacillus]KAF6574570.1 response regulator [Paenibacillus sp. EKM206P]KAF6589042.1 response regulator [Paenibacillus sp. EKM205P]MBM0633005.1 response regulator [Paenibacillus polymyxa]MBO3284325.1 response regulator [Paenibacillus polymyxa]ODB55688.1 chemotaxis response regulator protein-glutamate methylesterase [Paenibacillus polymyxa]
MCAYRVLVVDDSAFMRKIITDLIVRDESFNIVGTAANGKEAVEKVKELQPDLVTMDVEMPEMNGLEALPLIMAAHPLPVIMLSGINEQGMKETIMALEAGAFDFIRKPSIAHAQDIEQVSKALLEQMHTAMQAVRSRLERKEANERKAALEQAKKTPQQKPPGQAVTEKRSGSQASTDKSPVVPLAPSPAVSAQPKRDVGKSAPAVAKQETKRQQSGTSVTAGRIEQQPAAQPSNKSVQAPTVQKKEDLSKGIGRTPGQLNSTTTAAGKSLHGKDKAGLVKPEPHKTVISSATRTPAAATPPVAAPTVPAAPKGLSLKKGVHTSNFRKLVAVGCSTGGPRALKTLLERIPGDFPAPIVIVQHMPPNFTRSLAQRLNTLSPLRVVEAEQGMTLETGTAYIAPGGYQLRIVPGAGGKYTVSLKTEEARNGHRPSVDTMFESLLSLTSLERHLVLLTGMGSDGAKMMKKLYDAGVQSTFAENEETCVVYGMPRSAVELKCVRHLLPMQEIAPKLVQVVK